jgi:hypothetical protein
MIPSQLVFAPENAAAEPATPPGLSDYPAPAPDNGEDFSSFISQALNSAPARTGGLGNHDQPPPLPPAETDEPNSSPADGSFSGSIQCYGAGVNKVTRPAGSPDDAEKSSGDPKNGSDTVDSSAQNNLAAMLAGALVPPAKPDHQVPAPTLGKSANLSQGSDATPVPGIKTEASAVIAQNSSTETAAHAAGASGKGVPVGTGNLTAALKPVNGAALTAKDSPQAGPTPSVPVQNPSDSAKASTQATIMQTVASIGSGANPAVLDTGTSAALDSLRMKSTGQKTETAGRIVQKLPHAASIGSPSADSNSPSTGQTATAGSGRKSDLGSFAGMTDLISPAAAAEFHDGATRVAGPSADSAATQVERVANLVTQEALMIRQSGATNLAVSVKLDQHTELFVQLTNQNGQIQASLRCERGNLAGLDGHWGQLQESLARQNVQLVAPADRTSFRDQAGTYSDSAGSKNFDQSAQNERQPNGNSRMESAASNQPVAPAASVKAKRMSSGRKGWESWA